jgi:uncharacterized damage-inducible protein DinB
MRHSRAVFALSVLALAAAPLSAQEAKRAGVMGDLLQDVQGVEEKLVSLAQAIPADKFAWRPGEGVRSIGEVIVHVAADNWFIPVMAGVSAPANTGIGSGYETVLAYEQQTMAKDAAIAEMQRSFAHLKKAMSDTPDANLGQTVDMFGTQATRRALWVLATTHLHEHLGQMIAYARTNDVVPPWSRGGGQ